ncbi:hypothetical protein H696_01755 [Fonticula alba]|uniref:Aromatic-L-amino-acid decarboxylase n=1 Tax=Fonticula alba TaxID=691883 RepID=A0A058ZFW3_FONAL|nr:hypothetical protein H696_01755 [Fonticula alba]KCV72362.1 hypothetical protein H696_01755 [Fonticula alba]|eukprot:XP_009493940.1 hypothetical protein H696_01755 [Fonticula alba]
MNAEEFRKYGHQIVDYIADYYSNLERFDVLPDVEPGYLAPLLPASPPTTGEPFDQIFADFQKYIMPGVTHWQHPQFFAFFPGNSSFPAMLGDMLSGMISCVGFNWIASPACTELEPITLDWMAQIMGLAPKFLSESGVGGGVIQGSASEASLVAMIAARERKIRAILSSESLCAQHGIPPHTLEEINNLSEEQVQVLAAPLLSRMVCYTSVQAHSSIQKAAQVISMRIRLVDACEDTHRVSIAALIAQIETDLAEGLIPFYVCGTIGTTNTVAIDDIGGLADVAEKYGIWLHVDGAYAGSALACEEFRDGLQHAALARVQSLAINPHKWMLVNFDCTVFWVERKQDLLNALSIERHYYSAVKRTSPNHSQAPVSGRVEEYRNWQIPLGRRFRSLKLWFTMRAYGVEGLKQHIRRHVELARGLEEDLLAVRQTPAGLPVQLEMAPGRTLSVLNFRFVGQDDQFHLGVVNRLCYPNAQENQAARPAGKASTEDDRQDPIYIMTGRFNGQVTLRMSIGSPQTQKHHLDKVLARLLAAADALLPEAAAPAAAPRA